jgi:hypothetical protein
VSPYRLPEPTPKGAITDPETLSALISGLGALNPEETDRRRRRSGTLAWVREFWQKHQPGLVENYNNASEDDQVMSFLIRANRKRHVDRRAFLIDNGFLAGAALEKALKDRRGTNGSSDWRQDDDVEIGR